MLLEVLILVALFTILVFVVAEKTAPEGYEDESGFHYGKNPDGR